MTLLGDDHFDALGRLLDLEAEAERQEAAKPGGDGEGNALTSMSIREEDAGLGGRILLTFGLRDRAMPLPPTRLQSGSPVLLKCPNDGDPLAIRGVVHFRGKWTIHVAVDDRDDLFIPDGESWRIELSGDELARQRQKQAMQAAKVAAKSRLAELRDVLMGRREPAFDKPSTLPMPLDASQTEAVNLAMSAKDLAIVHGPPGTGKTTTLVEIIRQSVARGDRVLACAPSNLAVDNILERLVALGVNAVRLGHPARVTESLRAHTLDVLVEGHADAKQARKWYKEAHALLRKAGKWTRGKPEPGEKAGLRREARALIADARKLDERAVAKVIDGASVLCATLTGLNADLLGPRTFDLVAIDETAQATEPACWTAIGRAKRLVLAGDHCQLPPTILSLPAARRGLAVSLMERVVARYGPVVTRRLRLQYRMNDAIAAFSAREFYEGDLVPDGSVASHVLAGLPGVRATPLTESPVSFIDTAGAGYDEEEAAESRRNPQEAAVVVRLVRELLEAGVAPAQVAVIAPYAAQVKLLRESLDVPGLEIDSVDGFQGREKEAIVLSMVRSNPEGEIGFLADVRRTNVAMTRARRKLIVVGDSATLASHPFYQRLLPHFETTGAYGSVWELG